MSLIFFLFFLSGVASLTYEIVWMRQLALVFGVTTIAVSIILAVFMGGLALGSIVFGRWSDRSERPLLAYALLEIGIGLYGLIVPFLFDALQTPYVALYRLELPYGLLTLVRGILAALVLLPPTLLMGGTLPFLAKFLIRVRGDVGKQISLLYLVNTGGAVVGCAMAGFYLIENLGILGTTRVGVALNAVLATLAIALQSRFPRQQVAEESDEAAFASAGDELSSARVRLVLIAAGISGFTSLAYESFWTRALLRYLYNSTYAFTTMLTVFLAGIALGSLMYLVLPFRKSRPLLALAILQLGVTFGFLISAQLFSDLPTLSNLLVGPKLGSFGDTMRVLILRSSMILFVPALCLGAVVPLATDVCTRFLRSAGETVGKVYAVNTIGAILGTLALTFAFIPALGMEGSLVLLLCTNFALAIVLLVSGMPASAARIAACVALSAIFVAAMVTMPEDVFRRTFTDSRHGLVMYDEGATDTVGVVQSPNGQRTIVYQDKRGTAGTMTYPWNYFLGHFPVLLHPGEPKRGLHICFGVGNSLSAMARADSIETIDSVELSPHVIDAAPYFWTNYGVVNNEKINTIIDDGRNFVMATDKHYDVIELEPPEAFTTGVINLYTRDFYEDVYQLLNDDGVFVQWLPVGQGALNDEKMLFRAFQDVFPETTIWLQLAGGPILLVGTKQPLRIDYQLLKEKLTRPLTRKDLSVAQIHDAEDLLSLFIFGPETLSKILEGVAPVTEDRTVLDFSMPRYLGSGFGMGMFTRNARLEDGTGTRKITRQHIDFYWDQRRSVMPFLTNYDPDEREVMDRRIRERPIPSINPKTTRIMSKAEWERWASAPSS